MAGRGFFTYDVFLNFRGADTRTGFTGDLYNALNLRGIRTFIDDEDLQSGKQITPELHKAIEESRVAILVFSKDYASSSFCLDELNKILECVKGEDRMVLPVFYLVEPSDVRRQRGSYGEALDMLEKKFGVEKKTVNKWREALSEAANLSGLHFKKGDVYQYQFIDSIIKKVSSKINRPLLHVADYPVGLESRVHNAKLQLGDVESDDAVHMVGICGIGGIGKTTVARAVFNSIAKHFEGLCFLDDVRVNSAKYGLMHLQEMLLSEIIGGQPINIGSVSKGMSIIKQRLHRKKVLLVLDDVDKNEQLQALVGAPDWLGLGSRVIITTRDESILDQHKHKVERRYVVEELNDKEALRLFSWNAFKSDIVNPDYEHISNRALGYAYGLPLALEVIGSNLHGKEKEEWELVLARYERLPEKRILEILEVSYDSLQEEDKPIFLDIACCFGGSNLVDVEDTLKAHYGLSSIKLNIGALIEKSLIKINDGLVILHDLIQQMGRAIVQRESEEPGERSRLWFYDDVVQVLEENMGTSKIQMLILDFPKDEEHPMEGEDIKLDGEAFKQMKNLKTLVIRSGRFTQGPTYLPNSLRVLKWSKYPSSSFPDDFHPKRLALLELPESRLQPSKPIQRLVCLTVLDFGYNDSITEIPDVSGAPNLEKLSFKHCGSLTKIDDSVGYLEKLRILDAVRCTMLKTLPRIRLPALEQLNISHCSVLESFPEILGKMENIKELCTTGSPIEKFPSSIRNLAQLRKLELQSCGMVELPSSICLLPELCLMLVSVCEGFSLSKQDKGEEMVSKSSNIESLTLTYCHITDEFLPMNLTWFANVKDLNLSGNDFKILDACIKECHLLRNLKLDGCRNLRETGGIPWKLETFSAKECTSLKELVLTVLPASTGECHSLRLRELILDGCVYLREISGDLPNLDHFSAKSCTALTSNCTSKLLTKESIEAGNKMFSLPGTKIPEWFNHRTRGESISFWFRGKFPAISLGLVIGLVNEQRISVKFRPRVVINGNKQSLANRKVYEFSIATDHIFLFDLQQLKFEENVDVVISEDGWNQVEVSYADHITNDEVQIKQVAKHSGIHVIDQASSMGDMIRFKDPYYKKRRASDFLLTWDSKSHQSSLSARAVQNVNRDPNSMEGPHQRIKTRAMRPPKAQTKTVLPPSAILTSTQPSPAEAEKGQASGPTPSVERSREDVGGETSEMLREDEVRPTPIPNDPPADQEGRRGHDAELEVASFSKLEYEESSSNSKDSDSDDPFDQVITKLSVSGKQTKSLGTSSGDASLTSIHEAIDAFELLMVKDLSEVSSDPAMHSRLGHLLDLLSTSSHPKVTVEVKEALVEFKREAFASFQEFQATVELVNKLKYFEKERARIQLESTAGQDRRKDIRNSIKMASSAIEAENEKKKELESEVEALRKQLATKENDLEQLVLNIKNEEATLSTYSTTCASLEERAQALLKEANDLLAANSGVGDEGEAAEIKQNRIKSTWSTDLTTQFIKIKKKILGRYE